MPKAQSGTRSRTQSRAKSGTQSGTQSAAKPEAAPEIVVEKKSATTSTKKKAGQDVATVAEAPPVPLTGKVLLQKQKELSHLSRREIAKRCGYYTIAKDQKVHVNLTDFYDALLLAKGVSITPEISKDGRGREPTYRVSVHKNGQIVIGATYTEEMGLKPGDEFVIKLGYKHIQLKFVASHGEGGDAERDEVASASDDEDLEMDDLNDEDFDDEDLEDDLDLDDE
jgi:bifunctional DNA-binding transcriptional regulator/antitoxin component of YhaV-PrlF toxin-antitoxin module